MENSHNLNSKKCKLSHNCKYLCGTFSILLHTSKDSKSLHLPLLAIFKLLRLCILLRWGRILRLSLSRVWGWSRGLALTEGQGKDSAQAWAEAWLRHWPQRGPSPRSSLGPRPSLWLSLWPCARLWLWLWLRLWPLPQQQASSSTFDNMNYRK